MDTENFDLLPKNYTGLVKTINDTIPFVSGCIGAFSTVLFTYCMDCNKYLGSKDGKRVFGNSHGLCETCLDNRMISINNKRGI